MENEEKNLWPDLNDRIVKIDEIKNFLNKQCDFLNRQYANSINAKFEEMIFYQSSFSSLAQTMSKFAQIASSSFEVKNDSDSEKQDINEIVSKNKFVFTITNKKYKFNMFYLSTDQYFPITLEMDYDIATNLGCEKEIKLFDLENFKNEFQKIINTNKVKTVLYKMLNEN